MAVSIMELRHAAIAAHYTKNIMNRLDWSEEVILFFGNDLRDIEMQRQFYISMNDASINVVLDSLAQGETDTCKNQKRCWSAMALPFEMVALQVESCWRRIDDVVHRGMLCGFLIIKKVATCAVSDFLSQSMPEIGRVLRRPIKTMQMSAKPKGPST